MKKGCLILRQPLKVYGRIHRNRPDEQNTEQETVLTDQPVVFRSELIPRYLRPGVLIDQSADSLRQTGLFARRGNPPDLFIGGQRLIQNLSEAFQHLCNVEKRGLSQIEICARRGTIKFIGAAFMPPGVDVSLE